jgi:hypothetical protein
MYGDMALLGKPKLKKINGLEVVVIDLPTNPIFRNDIIVKPAFSKLRLDNTTGFYIADYQQQDEYGTVQVY